MRLGAAFLRLFGYRARYFKFFLKLYELSVMGMGYGRLMQDNEQEEYFVKFVSKQNRNKEITIVDIGANKGGFLEIAKRYFQNRKVRYFAFEPNDRLHQSIAKMVEEAENIDLHISAQAVSDKNETKSFGFSSKDVCSGFYTDASVVNQAIVETISLDSFADKEGIKTIDILKVDTEGHDFFVLKGAYRLIKEKMIKHIIFEFSDMAITPKVYFKDFWNNLSPYYRLYYAFPDGFVEIKEYRSLQLEIFYPNNFVAIRKS